MRLLLYLKNEKMTIDQYSKILKIGLKNSGLEKYLEHKIKSY